MKKIKGYENYLVSKEGVVSRGGKEIQSAMSNGYLIVSLCKNGIKVKRRVHRLVAIAFLPNPSKREQVNHLDGNKTNNHFLNLEWCSPKENIRHAILTGLRKITPKGVINGKSKLTEAEVISIRKSKETKTSLAKKYGISYSAIHSIINYKSWKHINE